MGEVMGGIVRGILGGMGILLVAALRFLLLYAAAEGIHLPLSIEETTRQTVHLLSQRTQISD